MTFLRPTSTLASSRNQQIQTIRMPKHLNAVSKIRLLKFSLDVSFLYYKHIFPHCQSCFQWVKSATKWQFIFLNQFCFPLKNKKIYFTFVTCAHTLNRDRLICVIQNTWFKCSRCIWIEKHIFSGLMRKICYNNFFKHENSICSYWY